MNATEQGNALARANKAWTVELANYDDLAELRIKALDAHESGIVEYYNVLLNKSEDLIRLYEKKINHLTRW